MLPDLPSPAENPSPSFHDVRTALSVLQGRSALIRRWLDCTPRPNQADLHRTLDAIEVQIQEIGRQLDSLEHATVGPPYFADFE